VGVDVHQGGADAQLLEVAVHKGVCGAVHRRLIGNRPQAQIQVPQCVFVRQRSRESVRHPGRT
jgi:hypothetical protein